MTAMKKPDFRVEPPSDWDTGLTERVPRALQDSPLHLFGFGGMTDDPERPDTDYCIILWLSAVTDGERGFLVITDDFAPPDTEREFAELMESVYDGEPRGDDYVTRAARWWPDGEHSPGLLDLTDPGAARAVIEAAYHEAFDGKRPIDHAAFLQRFAPYNWSINDETAERGRCIDLDGYGPEQDSASSG